MNVKCLFFGKRLLHSLLGLTPPRRSSVENQGRKMNPNKEISFEEGELGRKLLKLARRGLGNLF